MTDVFLCAMRRTPIGRYGGALAMVRPDDMAAQVIDGLLDLHPGLAVDEVIFGCANQAGEDNRNVARMAVLLSRLGPEVPALTVNRLCASGLDAVILGARAVRGRGRLPEAGFGALGGGSTAGVVIVVASVVNTVADGVAGVIAINTPCLPPLPHTHARTHTYTHTHTRTHARTHKTRTHTHTHTKAQMNTRPRSCLTASCLTSWWRAATPAARTKCRPCRAPAASPAAPPAWTRAG